MGTIPTACQQAAWQLRWCKKLDQKSRLNGEELRLESDPPNTVRLFIIITVSLRNCMFAKTFLPKLAYVL